MAWVLELHFSFWEICNSIVCDQMLLKNSRACIVVAIKKITQKLRWYENGYAMLLSWAELSMYCIFFIPEIANLLISVIETTLFSDSVEVLITLYSVHRLSFQSIKLCWLFRVYLVYFTPGEFWLQQSKHNVSWFMSTNKRVSLESSIYLGIAQTISELHNYFLVCSYLTSK